MESDGEKLQSEDPDGGNLAWERSSKHTFALGHDVRTAMKRQSTRTLQGHDVHTT